MRAGVQLALTGKKKQGGSTITMQVARNFYLSRKKTYTRKLSEIFLALRIEKELSKQEILGAVPEQDLSRPARLRRRVPQHASITARIVDELDLAQTAMIAGLPKAPSQLQPAWPIPRVR